MAYRRYKTTCLYLFVLACTTTAVGIARAQTIVLDRVVATVSGAPLTASDASHECALEAFLGGRSAPADPSTAERTAALSRLIDRRLLAQHLGNYRFDSKTESAQAEKRLTEIKQRFRSEQAFADALRSLDLNESQLLGHLEQQDEILEMVDRRLRPAAAVSPKDVAAYYQETFLPDYARAHGGAPPSLADTESRIREILTQKRINALLADWIAELRKENNVRILPNEAGLARTPWGRRLLRPVAIRAAPSCCPEKSWRHD